MFEGEEVPFTQFPISMKPFHEPYLTSSFLARTLLQTLGAVKFPPSIALVTTH